MKPTKILKLALLGAAVIPAAAMADSEKTLELRAGVRGADDKTIAARTVAKAPENASYQTALVGFVYYADSWNNLPDNEYTPMGIYTIGAKPGSQPACLRTRWSRRRMRRGSSCQRRSKTPNPWRRRSR